ncbi:hypothetical protein OSB04_004743 [Centaurea solstitialis]|uniref:BHLH domain-containing protein n=1 Tax=Centaurea solstitialis TaxID=347529 RepID=A0AA38TZB9_9ASTR|nr:hypothetical protein OSB04_004743 [Centaurea solstitialis]
MALGFYTNWSDHDTAGGYSSLFRPPSPELPPELFFFNEPPSLYDNYNINHLFDPTYNPDLLPPVSAASGGGGSPLPEFQVSTFFYKDPYLHHFPYPTTFNHHYHLPPLQPPETYEGGGGGGAMCSWYGRGGGGGGGGGGDKVEERGGVQGIGKQKQGRIHAESSEPHGFFCSRFATEQKVGSGGGGGVVRLSAQSMAARVRRRKISEKTQELGRLIPGGRKMNTAEMFQAAFKYIKFLQAQVGVLKLMDPIPEGEQVLGNEELMEALVTCTSMQEKLYTAEKCIVSKHFAETLAIN